MAADKAGANLELAIGLPLDVVVDKLKRLEAELRYLNMKAFGAAAAASNDRSSSIEPRVEAIYEALETIRQLVADIEADLRPSPTAPGAPASISRPAADQDD